MRKVTVLAALAGDRQWTVYEMSAHLRSPDREMQKILKKCFNQGLVDREIDEDGRYHYWLNADGIKRRNLLQSRDAADGVQGPSQQPQWSGAPRGYASARTFVPLKGK